MDHVLARRIYEQWRQGESLGRLCKIYKLTRPEIMQVLAHRSTLGIKGDIDEI